MLFDFDNLGQFPLQKYFQIIQKCASLCGAASFSNTPRDHQSNFLNFCRREKEGRYRSTFIPTLVKFSTGNRQCSVRFPMFSGQSWSPRSISSRQSKQNCRLRSRKSSEMLTNPLTVIKSAITGEKVKPRRLLDAAKTG